MPLLRVVQLYRSRETAEAWAEATAVLQGSLDGVRQSDGSGDSPGMAGRQQRAVRPVSAPIGPSGAGRSAVFETISYR